MDNYKYFRSYIGTGILCLVICIVIFLSCIPPQIHFAVAPVAEVKDSLNDTCSDEPVIILADSTQLIFQPQELSNTVTSQEITWYSVRKRNPTLLQTFSIPDFETTEDIPIIKAMVFYDNGKTWSLSPSAIIRKRYSEKGISTSNQHIQLFTIPNYSERMQIRVCITRHYNHPEFISRWVIRKEYPSHVTNLSFTYPLNSIIKYGFLNAESLKIDTSLIVDGQKKTFSVTGHMLRKLPVKESTPLPEQWYAALNVSFPPAGQNSLSWQQMGDHYLKMLSSVLPKIDTTISLLKGAKRDSLADKLYLNVRSRIRYHAELQGMFAYRPRTIEKILTNGYGDCKEMSLLLMSDLQKNGIPSGLALVATPGVAQLNDSIATLGLFNHMICYYTDNNGSTRYLDPTVQYGNPAQSCYWLIGRKTFVLKPGNSSIAKITPDSNYQNEIITHAIVKKSISDNSWIQQGTVRFTGFTAHRIYPFISCLQDQERIPLLKTLCKEDLNLICTSLSITTLQPEIIEFSYSSDIRKNYLSVEKGGILIDAPSIANVNLGVTATGLDGPIQIDSFSQHDIWELPYEFLELESKNIQVLLGTGMWKLDGHLLSRDYSQRFNTAFKYGDTEINSLFMAKKMFSKATVWK